MNLLTTYKVKSKEKRSIKYAVVKALLARSGNRCAFPDCEHPLFNEDDLFVGQLCHIEAVSKKGQRFNPEQANDERNGYGNLLFLCYRHHKETDDVARYPVESLKAMKADHEAKFTEGSFKVQQTMIKQIQRDMDAFWNQIGVIQRTDEMGLLMEINERSAFDDLFAEVISLIAATDDVFAALSHSNDELFDNTIEFLEKLDYATARIHEADYFDNPLCNRDWELLNLAAPNLLSKIQLRLAQLELKYYEEKMKSDPVDDLTKLKFEKLKEAFKESAGAYRYRD